MAITAAAAQVHPWTPQPPPARRTVAGLACTNLVWTAVHAVICLFVASVWLLMWGLATMEIGLFACGWGCAVYIAGYKVAIVAGVTLVPVLPLTLLLEQMMFRAPAAAAVPVAAAAATEIGATKVQEPALKTSDVAMRVRRALRDPLILAMLASMSFALLSGIGILVIGDVMGSRRQITGSVIFYVGASGMNTVDCFVLCPLITVRVWRSWRKARQVL